MTIELTDAESGLITWAKRYDTAADGLMRSPHELCPLIAAALDPAIAESEQNALGRPSLASTGSVIDEGPHNLITRQPLGVVDILLAGQAVVHRLAQKT